MSMPLPDVFKNPRIGTCEALLGRYVDTEAEFYRTRNHIQNQGFAIAKTIRVARGYSLRKFAEILHVSPSYLSKVEQGKERMSTLLAQALLEQAKEVNE